MEQPTQKLQAIYDRLLEIEDDTNPDFYDSMCELRDLEKSADSLGAVFDIPGIKNIQESTRLYAKIRKKISQLRRDISGYDPGVETRSMFPNPEDYEDYCDGEF
ncbi:hypothetical protein [Bacteroides acidifaciens]|uniref:hypothetical protein n=1 Tax=Bacteroides acidifaciens TaxID=85831 RepID=UPI00263B194D|nr:hypothetical protein [Bacteroides acidifaciens]